MNKDKKKRVWCSIVGILFWLWIMGYHAAAADLSVLEGIEGVTISPGGTAWTTDYLDRTNEHLPEGYTIDTGQSSSLRSLREGEHYYAVNAVGNIPIGKWVVAWSNAQCIHDNPGFQTFCGFPIKSDNICYAYYNNGWYAYCADCGELVEDLLFYGTQNTMRGITKIPASAMYAYICPYCEGLEQGRSYTHTCKAISYNYYEIVYQANAPQNDKLDGFMPSTKHMYDNADTYNGIDAEELGYAARTLRKNTYTCEGYRFLGWNTKADGSGTFFKDCAEVFNLGTEDGEQILLYAQWEKTKSTLLIDANGGTYQGAGQYECVQEYGTTYEVLLEVLKPAAGYRVSFETNGGSNVSDIKTTKQFAHWEMQGEFVGIFADPMYTFLGTNGQKDTLKAQYVNDPFLLPAATKGNASLVGWYTSPDLKEEDFVGRAGDLAVVEKDVILYAKWSTLTLWAYDDYESHNGEGAVDLKWEQKDGQSKYYRVFQSLDKTDWTELFSSGTDISQIKISQQYGIDQQGSTYTIPYTGYYMVTASGAKGADHTTGNKGGKGGSVSAEYWLQQGDVLHFYAGTTGNGTSGGTNGLNAAGGNADSYHGSGGGAATEVYVTRNGTKTLLLVAGGGGGGNEQYAGGDGGKTISSAAAMVGKNSEFGGGGGGATGGEAGGSFRITTLKDTTDYAFQSNLSKNMAAGTLQVYGMNREVETPSLYKTEGNQQNQWKLITKMGTLSTQFTKNYSLWYDTEAMMFVGKETGNAAVGTVPYIQVQARDGVSMSMSQTYETNENTHLLLGGGLYRQDYGAAGNTLLYMKVTNADTGAVLFQNNIYHGYSDNNQSGIAAVVDVDISSAKKVKVSISSETEGTQEATQGHKTQLYLSDIIFYGKTVSSAKATSGGSNYIHTGFGCKNQNSKAGANAEHGQVLLEGTEIGYQEVTSMEDVSAKDQAAPEQIQEYTTMTAGKSAIKLVITEPKDHGTTYYHMAKSYRLDKDEVKQLAVSNITENTLTTGVKGYYYCLDAQSDTMVEKKHQWISKENEELLVTLTKPVMYLHIAAVDGAGNIGKTTHIRLEMDAAIPTDQTYAQQCSLYTQPLAIQESEFMYQASERVYYVKADGKTLHQLIANGYMDGAAKNDYQIESGYFCIENSLEWFKVSVPYADVAQNSVSYKDTDVTMTASDGYKDYMQIARVLARRMEHGGKLYLQSGFSVSADTPAFCIYPRVSATLSEQTYYSEEAADKTNQITIIPDGIAPVIDGLEALAAWDVFDMTEETKTFILQAKDMESGLETFTITIKNQDNKIKQEFFADEAGKIVITMEKENPLFVGEVIVTAIAVDRVGNANIVGEDGLNFTLETKLYKEKNPQEDTFKTGETAVLEVEMRGYVEKIEIVYPKELLERNQELPTSYVYDPPYLSKTEKIQFEIPLGIAEKEYKITIKAYKNDDILVSKEKMMIVEGNVLDELRTRIRNNG